MGPPEAAARRPRRQRFLFAIEWLLVALVAMGIVNCFQFLAREGYLPPPFVYDPNDTFMDWYNSAYFAVKGGMYDVWGSIYPPLSFVFLKIFTIHACYGGDPLLGRDCDWLGRWFLVFILFANAGLVFASYRRSLGSAALPRTLALAFGLPMIFALERGNLILPCFTCFVLAHGRLLRSARLKWLAAALSINFKPYLIAAVAPAVFKRQWRWVEGCALATLAVYVISYAVLGAGTPAEMLANMSVYVEGGGNSLLGAVWYAASYSALLNYLAHGVPLIRFVGSSPVEAAQFAIPLLVRAGQVFVLLAFGFAAAAPKAVSSQRLAALGMALALSATEFGGYAEVFLLFLVFEERRRDVPTTIALIAAYCLCIPGDLRLVSLSHHAEDSWLTNRTVGNDVNVNLGLLLRPGFILIIEYALSAATILTGAKAWSDARMQRLAVTQPFPGARPSAAGAASHVRR